MIFSKKTWNLHMDQVRHSRGFAAGCFGFRGLFQQHAASSEAGDDDPHTRLSRSSMLEKVKGHLGIPTEIVQNTLCTSEIKEIPI